MPVSLSEPGDTLSVWGWMPSFYVETGLKPATRDTIGHYIISPGPYQDYFQEGAILEGFAARAADDVH